MMVRMRYGLIVVTLLLGCGGKKNDNAAAAGSGSASGAVAAPAAPAPAPATAPAGAGVAPTPAPAAGGGPDPWQAQGGEPPSGAVAADDDPDPTPTETETEPASEPASAPVTAADATRAGMIAKFCEKATSCACAQDNCEEAFAKIPNTPASMYACFITQSCETLCAENSGAPGTALYTACIAGKRPAATGTGGGGGVAKRCARQSDCGGGYDCCSGLCYQMGTSLWITACQMPTGKF